MPEPTADMLVLRGVDVDEDRLVHWIADAYIQSWPIERRSDEDLSYESFHQAYWMISGELLERSCVLVDTQAEILAVVSVRQHFLGPPELMVHTLLATGGSAAVSTALPRLVSHAMRLPGAEEWLAIRVLAPWSWHEALFEMSDRVVAYVRKRIDASEAAAAAAKSLAGTITVERMKEEDRPFVLDLLCRALHNGMHPFELALADGLDLVEYAAAVLDQMERSSPCIFVARDAKGARVGHALAQCCSTEFLMNSKEATLHDVFVVPDCTERGVGRALADAVELAAARAGKEWLLSTVHCSSSEETVALLDRLGASGWVPSYGVWSLAAAGVATT